jgi:hypothetical protein
MSLRAGRILLSIISIIQENGMKIIMVIKVKITSFRHPVFQLDADARSVIDHIEASSCKK